MRNLTPVMMSSVAFGVLVCAAATTGTRGDCAASGGSLGCLVDRIDNSLLAALSPEPDSSVHAPNQTPREVHSGHYVLVPPTPLPEPYLVACVPAAALLLGIDRRECASEAFVRAFSGDVRVLPGFDAAATWAAPYAFSIYGQEVQPAGAGPRGDGYGDGRAISIFEVIAGGARWEVYIILDR